MSVRTSLVLGVRGENLTDGLQQSLLVGGDGARQVETEAPAEPPGRSRVELGTPLHLVELHHDVPGVEYAGPGRYNKDS